MIYVTVGRNMFGFERLIKQADKIIPLLGEDGFFQTGTSAYRPLNAEYRDYIPLPEAKSYISNASLVISHAGMGTIIEALGAGTPIIVVPRRKKYGEHFNDHQMEICEVIKDRHGIEVVYEVDDLLEAVARVGKNKKVRRHERTGAGLSDAVEEFLERL